FSGDAIAYEHPVTAAKPPLGTGPGVTLFDAEAPADRNIPVRIGAVKLALRNEIAAEIEHLRSRAGDVPISEIYVLTRSNVESREIAIRLHQGGIPNVLFKPDDIFKSAEAAHVRALLLAIADPTDRAARLAAWLTPFFDVRLDQLENSADPPPDHPLVARLSTWNTLGAGHSYDDLWSRILDDSGVARRLRLSPAGLRRLTNYRHLFDMLHAETTARPLSMGDLATLLGAYAAGHRRPARADDDTQRLETEADAVRIMTIHAAKGLEADFVFIYGGLTGARFWRSVHALRRDGVRLRCVGKPRRECDIDRIDAARQEEEQRLLYVAMTRVRKHLYLPFFPAVEAGDLDAQGERGGGDFDPFKKISGEYRHVNQRLRVLTADPSSAALFQRRSISILQQAKRDGDETLAQLKAWTPDATVCAGGGDTANDPTDLSALLRAGRRGFAITSYSRLSEADGGYHPPALPRDDESPNTDDLSATTLVSIAPSDAGVSDGRPPTNSLPGGLASGLFLHGILEKVPLGILPALAAWQTAPDVRLIIESESRRWEREARHFDEAARLVHAALTVSIQMPDGSRLPGIARARRVRREVDFLFPLPTPLPTGPTMPLASPEERIVHERGFVRGALDVLFEHDGRLCFGDWKSNVLPDFSAAAVREHVALNYDLQIKIYTLALVRMLGITTRSAYDSRFGGLVYLFLRGLTSPERDVNHGLYVQRPDYDDVQVWDRELATRRVAGAGGQ
ncbi:MAG: hypothetical protein H7X95_05315, partial [Deltaproteobacteria bacterium]|nr:hypothetical protein [Deltaproteobacteria bacterium]